MASEWPQVELGDVVDLLTGFPFKSERYVATASAPRLLRGDNVAQGDLRWNGVKRWPQNAVDGLEKYWLRNGDVVLAMDRPWIEAGLKYAAARESDLPSLLVQRVARLRGTERLDTRFLKFLIGSREFTQHVIAVQTGTAVPHISARQIQSFRFRLPPLDQQRAIASILGTLDDKIELNRQMNQTLEQIAATLFTSWFVAFDPVRAKAEGRQPEGMDAETAALFPDRFVESEIGEIPEGWRVARLDSIAHFLNGLAMQKYPPNGDQSLPVIKIAQLRKGNTEGADRASADLDPEYVVDDGDVLFSWSGSLDVEIWTGGRGALNQHLFKVTSDEFPLWFCFLWTRHHLPWFRELARDKATTMGHIQRRHLAEARVILPTMQSLTLLSMIMTPLFEALVNNSLQSRTLASLRELLLPGLLSGELSAWRGNDEPATNREEAPAALLRKSLNSLTLAIELFNRPSDLGRTDTVLMLLDHSFEMLLKSAIVQRGARIRDRGMALTIGFQACIDRARSNPKCLFLSQEEAQVLAAINALRDAAQHYLLDISEEQFYFHVQSGVTLARDLLQRVFGIDLISFLPRRVLPISTVPLASIELLYDEKIDEIRKMLAPGKRRRQEAIAALRPLIILDRAIRGDSEQPSEGELNRIADQVKRGEDWQSVFPGVDLVEFAADGSGPAMALRIAKKEGIPIVIVPPGTDGAGSVALKRVNELDYYNLSSTQIAKHLGVTVPKFLALAKHLDLASDEEYFKVISFGSQRYNRYSQKALARARQAAECLTDDDWEHIWKTHGSYRGKQIRGEV